MTAYHRDFAQEKLIPFHYMVLKLIFFLQFKKINVPEFTYRFDFSRHLILESEF